MTNKEKFKEIFGIEPDCGRCNPYPCEENDCIYWAECENQPGCPCDNWWDWEFKEPKAECEKKMNCDDCLYTDIAEWEKDGDPERIKPLIWCKKYDKFCSDVADCKYKTESKAEDGECK